MIPDEDDIVEVEELDDPSSEAVYLEAVRHYIDKQVNAYDVLDSKAHQRFTAGGFAFTVTFALVNLAPERVDVPEGALLALRGALIAYGLLIVFIAIASRFKTLGFGPFPDEVATVSLSQLPGVGLQRWVADVYRDASGINRKTLRWKGFWVTLSNWALWVEGACLGAAAALTLWGGF